MFTQCEDSHVGITFCFINLDDVTHPIAKTPGVLTKYSVYLVHQLTNRQCVPGSQTH